MRIVCAGIASLSAEEAVELLQDEIRPRLPGEFLPREPQLGIGRPHACFGQAELAADDIGALDQRDALVERDAPRQALAAEAAIGADDELFLGMYSSALRISAATWSAGSTTVLQ